MQIEVRYDPYNIGIAYGFVRKRWVQLIYEYYSLFVNHTECEIKLASGELRKRMKQYRQTTAITGKKLAEFLKSVEAQETLKIQRLRDNEAKTIYQVIDGGKS